MDRWKGKTAVVTGANAGIGAAIAVQLVNAGMRVIGLDVNLLANKKISQAQGQGSLHSLHCDVTKSDELTTAFNWIEEQYGCVHVYVNNAGVNIPGHITASPDTTFQRQHLLMFTRATISPGLVDTAMASGIKDMPSLKADDVANTVLYALSVPPNVNISEITIQPVGEKRL
ncbi:unnamed protein product [Diatraea saccharalis]|uniref:Farnesol dehydrogenase-like n=1 Tax=Diatraea saccharalis TaxID=40085 RepID=A0A9N9R8D8_9NEOP|nr:unnamed protein product [Diatraea saccharalis]